MTNKIQEGEVLDYVNTTNAKVLSNQLVFVGILFGVAVADIEPGATGAINLTGVYEFPKATGAIAQGEKVYWSAANSNVTKTATDNIEIGAAARAELSATATVRVLLCNAR